MARDWRTAMCTKWRPLATILMAGILLLFFGLVSQKMQSYQDERLERRAALLSLGMTEPELIGIMGKPQFSNLVKTEDIGSGLLIEGNLEDVRREYKQLVEYVFVARRAPLSNSVAMVSGIYLDEQRKKVVLRVLSTIGWMDQFIAAGNEGLLLIVTCVIVPWLGLRLWCKRRLRKTGV